MAKNDKDRGSLDGAGEAALQAEIDRLKSELEAVKAGGDSAEAAQLRAALAESDQLIEDMAEASGFERPKNPPKPEKIVKEERDLGPAGSLIARGDISLSQKRGDEFGGLIFKAGEYLPESFPEDAIKELRKQKQCPLWDTADGPYRPFASALVPAPVVAERVRGLLVRRRGARLHPDAYVEPGAVGLPE